MTTLVQCTRCPYKFFYVRTKAGKSMPVDPAPDLEGNVEIIDGVAEVHGPMLAQLARDEGRTLWQSHFPTCDKWLREHPGQDPTLASRPSTLREARAAAAEGIAQVKGERSSPEEKAARDAWRSWAYDWTVVRLRERKGFVAEESWAAGMKEAGSHLWRDDLNWTEKIYGPVVQQLARDGLIVKVGDQPRLHGHGAPGNRWESTIYCGTDE